MDVGEKKEGKIPEPKYRCGVEEPIISEEEIASLT